MLTQAMLELPRVCKSLRSYNNKSALMACMPACMLTQMRCMYASHGVYASMYAQRDETHASTQIVCLLARRFELGAVIA
eukprot:1160218-Pelagomonas_calceolata.AAC.13